MARPSQSPRDLRPVPAAGPGRTTWLVAGVAAFVFLVIGVVIMFRLVSRPRHTIAGNVPANFFQQAVEDYNEAGRLLADGRLSDSAEKFSEAQVYRSRAGDRPVKPGVTFESWCAARDREYRAAAAAIAASLPARVGQPGGPSILEMDTFLERFGNDAARAAWRQQRPGLERRVATATAAGAYRIEWSIQDDEGNALDDLHDGDQKLLAEALARRIGATSPFVPASATPGVAPEQGLGYVAVTLVFAEAPYKSERTRIESSVKVPAALSAEVQVTTNKTPGRWDGAHRYIARVDPPQQLTDKTIAATRVELQRALITRIVEQVSSDPTERTGRTSNPDNQATGEGRTPATNP